MRDSSRKRGTDTAVLSDMLRNGSRLRSTPFRDCNREVLIRAVCRYVLARSLPREKRSALATSGITEKRIKSHAAEAKSLAGFLREVQENAHLVLESYIPQADYFLWKQQLERIAEFLGEPPVREIAKDSNAKEIIRVLQPFRPSVNDVALALALHLEQKTGSRQIRAIASLLSDAFLQAELPYRVEADALRNQIKRGDSGKAQRLLHHWSLWSAIPEIPDQLKPRLVKPPTKVAPR